MGIFFPRKTQDNKTSGFSRFALSSERTGCSSSMKTLWDSVYSNLRARQNQETRASASNKKKRRRRVGRESIGSFPEVEVVILCGS